MSVTLHAGVNRTSDAGSQGAGWCSASRRGSALCFLDFLGSLVGGGLETGGQDKAEVVMKGVCVCVGRQILRCSALLEGWIAMQSRPPSVLGHWAVLTSNRPSRGQGGVITEQGLWPVPSQDNSSAVALRTLHSAGFGMVRWQVLFFVRPGSALSGIQ